MKKKLAILLMLLGILAALLAAGLWGYNLYEDAQAEDSAQQILQALIPQVEPKEDVDPFNEEMTIVQIDGYGYVGYLTIPTLQLDLPVMASCDQARLKIAPCRYYGSTKTDNLVIAAHNCKSHFGTLKTLNVGDLVTFTDMDATQSHYAVTSVEILSPTAVDRVKDTGDDLILYTCTYSGAQRVVVRCSYIQ